VLHNGSHLCEQAGLRRGDCLLAQNLSGLQRSPGCVFAHRDLDILFPVRHWETVSQQAARLKIDSNLVLAVIRQESAFNEKASSKANARGLMQILHPRAES